MNVMYSLDWIQKLHTLDETQGEPTHFYSVKTVHFFGGGTLNKKTVLLNLIWKPDEKVSHFFLFDYWKYIYWN